MNDFKKSGRFGGGGNKGGFSKGGFGRVGARNHGGFKKDFGGSSEMFQATCANCKKSCQVPFRPNGLKPVFCKDCFAQNKPGAFAHPSSRADLSGRALFRPEGRFEKHSELRERGGSDLAVQIAMLNSKLDTLTKMMGTFIPAISAPKEVAATKKVSTRKSAKK